MHRTSSSAEAASLPADATSGPPPSWPRRWQRRLDDALVGWVARAPPPERFPRAVRLARVLGLAMPLAARLTKPLVLDFAPFPYALRHLMFGFARHRLRFDPPYDVTGGEHLAQASPSSGLLVVTVHLTLGRLAFRALHDRGHRLAIIAAPAPPGVSEFIPGVDTPAESIANDPRCLLRAHEALRRGRLVVISLDMPERRDGAYPLTGVSGRTKYVYDTAFRFAERAGVPLVCSTAFVDAAGRASVTLHQPAARPWLGAGSADACARECVAFFAAQLDRQAEGIPQG